MDDVHDARIPVAHPGGDEDRIRTRKALQLRLYDLHGKAIAAVVPADMGHGRWPSHNCLQEVAAAVEVIPRRARQPQECRMSPIQAIEEMYLVPLLPEQGADGKQAQGVAPQIVGSEVADPGIDEQHMGTHRHCLRGVPPASTAGD
jgi:hypothetical protein